MVIRVASLSVIKADVHELLCHTPSLTFARVVDVNKGHQSDI